MIDNFNPRLYTAPSQYNDNVTYTLPTHGQAGNALKFFILDHLVHVQSNNMKLRFKKSIYKAGYPLTNVFNQTVYFDFEVENDGSQTVYYWIPSGSIEDNPQDLLDFIHSVNDEIDIENYLTEAQFDGWVFEDSVVPTTNWSKTQALGGCSVSYNNCDTSNIESLENAFYGFRGTLDGLDNWDVSNVLTVEGCFSNLQTTNLDISGWDIPSATGYYGIIQDSQINYLNMSQWVIPSGDLRNGLLGDNYNVSTLDVTNWDVSNVSDGNLGWIGTIKLGHTVGIEQIIGLNTWDVSSITEFTQLFDCEVINSQSPITIDLSNWDVRQMETAGIFDGFPYGQNDPVSYYNIVLNNWILPEKLLNDQGDPDTSMSNLPSLFLKETPEIHSRSGIGSVTVNNWNLEEAENLNDMFCNINTELYGLDTWDMGNITNIDRMFYSSRIRNQEMLGIGEWDVSSITSMNGLFKYAKFDYPTITDISSWDVSSVTDFSNMFSNFDSTAFNGNFSFLDGWDEYISRDANYNYMFYNCNVTRYPDWDGTWDSDGTFHPHLSFVTIPNGSIATLTNAVQSWNGQYAFTPVTKNNADKLEFYGFPGVTYPDTYSYVPSDDDMARGVLNYNIDTFKQNATVVQTSDSNYPIYLYNGYYYCEKQIGFADNANFTAIKNPVVTYCGAKGVSFRDWDTTLVTSLAHAFDNKDDLVFLDVTGWNVSHVTDMNNMFNSTEYIGDVFGINDWNTSSVIDMSNLFCRFGTEASSYSSSSLSRQYHQHLWNNEGKLTRIDLSNWNTSHVTNMSGMLKESIITLPGTIDTSSVTNMESMAESLVSCDSDHSSHIYTTDITLEWDTSNVTNMKKLFKNDKSYRIVVSNDNGYWNMGNVLNTEEMFYGSYIQFSGNFDTSKVTNMKSMFENSSGVIQSDTTLDTRNVIDMSGMFKDIDYENPSEHASYYYPANMSGWDVSKVQDFTETFNTGYYAYSHAPFEDIDVSNWDTSSATVMDGMFSTGDGALDEVSYTTDRFGFGNLDLSNVTSATNMFSGFPLDMGCVDFSGWDLTNCDIDGMFASANINEIVLPSDIPMDEYLFSNSNVETMIIDNRNVNDNTELNNIKETLSDMGVCHNLKARNWTFDPSITSFSGLFSRVRTLRDVDLEGWDTQNITNFSYMFWRPEETSPEIPDYPGVLDFSSLNDWDISSGSDFTMMCATNLQDNEEEALESGNHAFEQSHLFPDWNGTWDTTGLLKEQVTMTNLPYYHRQAGIDYEANTFGTTDPDKTLETTRIIGIPPQGFGTFVPSA